MRDSMSTGKYAVIWGQTASLVGGSCWYHEECYSYKRVCIQPVKDFQRLAFSCKMEFHSGATMECVVSWLHWYHSIHVIPQEKPVFVSETYRYIFLFTTSFHTYISFATDVIALSQMFSFFYSLLIVLAKKNHRVDSVQKLASWLQF